MKTWWLQRHLVRMEEVFCADMPQIGTLKFEIDTLKFSIDTLKFPIGTLKFAIDTLKFAIDTLKFQITTLKNVAFRRIDFFSM